MLSFLSVYKAVPLSESGPQQWPSADCRFLLWWLTDSVSQWAPLSLLAEASCTCFQTPAQSWHSVTHSFSLSLRTQEFVVLMGLSRRGFKMFEKGCLSRCWQAVINCQLCFKKNKMYLFLLLTGDPGFFRISALSCASSNI